MKKLLLNALAILTVCSLKAQIETPQPSPTSTLMQKVGLTDITVEYSRPSAKGRTIFGDLVPFGKIWRTGANASTKIEFSEPVELNGTAIPAGEYALYTIPNENTWDVIIHGNTTHWGVGEYNQEEDVARFKATAEASKDYVETFSIYFDELRPNSGTLVLAWANTQLKVDVQTNTAEKVAKQIAAFENPKPNYRPYYSAASYFYESGKDLDKALEYANKAVELRDAFWVLHLKAKIQYKLGAKKEAIKTAEMSKTKATEAGNEDYVALNNKLIAKCKS